MLLALALMYHLFYALLFVSYCLHASHSYRQQAKSATRGEYEKLPPKNRTSLAAVTPDSSPSSSSVLYEPLASTSTTFSYTGAVQTFVASLNGVQIESCGAQGGSFSGTGGAGGNGGCITATIAITPGTTLYVYVGGAGTTGSNSNSQAVGGYNGGGNGVYGSGGGGASDVRTNQYDLTA